MSPPVPVVTMRMHIAEGQYEIGDWDPDREFVLIDPGGASGLVGVAPGRAVVITGTQFGNVAIGVQAGESDPGLDTGPWDEVVEVSVVSGPGGQGLCVSSGGDGPEEFGQMTPPGAGSYRVRVHARGRDTGAALDVVEDEPVEEHLVQIWPAAAAPEVIHKAADEVGAGLREYDPSVPEPRLPHGRYVMLNVHQPVTTSERATVELLRMFVRRAGCEFEFKIAVDTSGMAPRQEKQARRAIDGYPGANFPDSAQAMPLRVIARFGDGRITQSSADMDSLPRGGPGMYNQLRSSYPEDRNQVREEGFWLWPLPPAEPFTLTLEWPAVGISPASITVDGAMIARTAANLPPE
jgi:hypothetical protein